jgi:hypothetical protein
MADRGIKARHPGLLPNIEAPCGGASSSQKGDDTMTTYRGNSKVKSGYYFSTRSFGIEVVPEGGGTLPGPAEVRYVGVPFPLLFVLAPIVGLAFLVFLPFIGFALLGVAIFRRVTGHVEEGASALAATVAPPPATGAAWLGGREGEKAAEPSEELKKLEEEVKSKRS